MAPGKINSDRNKRKNLLNMVSKSAFGAICPQISVSDGVRETHVAKTSETNISVYTLQLSTHHVS